MDNKTKTAMDLAEAAIKTGRSQQLIESVQTRQQSLRSERVLDRGLIIHLWTLMTEMYGHKWTSQFGDQIDPSNVWAASLRGLSQDQIKHGLSQCVVMQMQWPPSAPEFRGMCSGESDVSWEHKRQSKSVHEALGYEPKALVNITAKEKMRAKGKAEVAKLKDLLKV